MDLVNWIYIDTIAGLGELGYYFTIEDGKITKVDYVGGCE